MTAKCGQICVNVGEMELFIILGDKLNEKHLIECLKVCSTYLSICLLCIGWLHWVHNFRTFSTNFEFFLDFEFWIVYNSAQIVCNIPLLLF